MPQEYFRVCSLFGASPDRYFMCDDTVASLPPEEMVAVYVEPVEDDELLTRQLKARLNSTSGRGPGQLAGGGWPLDWLCAQLRISSRIGGDKIGGSGQLGAHPLSLCA